MMNPTFVSKFSDKLCSLPKWIWLLINIKILSIYLKCGQVELEIIFFLIVNICISEEA